MCNGGVQWSWEGWVVMAQRLVERCSEPILELMPRPVVANQRASGALREKEAGKEGLTSCEAKGCCGGGSRADDVQPNGGCRCVRFGRPGDCCAMLMPFRASLEGDVPEGMFLHVCHQ